jgi:hypothetical protein
MRWVLGPCALIAAWVVALASANAQGVRTEAPCSPVIERTQGLIANVTVNFVGGCTAGITQAQIQQIIDGVRAGQVISPELLEKHEQLSQRFGVTDMAVTTFLRKLGERNVAVEDLDAKLREIAAQHLTLREQAKPRPGEDPKVQAIKKRAVVAIDSGDYADESVKKVLEDLSEQIRAVAQPVDTTTMQMMMMLMMMQQSTSPPADVSRGGRPVRKQRQ